MCNVLHFVPPSEFNYVKPVLKVFSHFFVYTGANGERRFKTLYFYLILSLLTYCTIAENIHNLVKFRYSEKATNVWPLFC